MANSMHILLRAVVAEYLEAIQGVRTENVVANHVSMSKRFLSYFSSHRPVRDLAKLGQADLLAFLDWLTHRRGRFTAHTYNMGVEFIKRLTRFCLARNWLEEDPAAEISYQEIKPRTPEVLTREEMARLIEGAGEDDLNRVLVGLLGEVGLKKQELVNLRFADLELDDPNPEIVVRYTGKLKRKTRRLALPEALAAALRRYTAYRQEEGTYGFLTPLVPITGRQVNNIIATLCRQAGVRRANPQMLRDSAAAHMLLAGRPPEEVGQQLGYTPRGYLLEFLPRFQVWMEPSP